MKKYNLKRFLMFRNQLLLVSTCLFFVSVNASAQTSKERKEIIEIDHTTLIFSIDSNNEITKSDSIDTYALVSKIENLKDYEYYLNLLKIPYSKSDNFETNNFFFIKSTNEDLDNLVLTKLMRKSSMENNIEK